MAFAKRGGALGSILPIALALAALAYVLLTGGCDIKRQQAVKEEDESHYIRGQEEKRRGDYKEALSAFQKVVEKRADAPESHMEIGLICLNYLNDPVAAIYHFRKYLELKPDTKQSQFVRQCIETAQKKFAASLPCNPFGLDDYNLKLEESLRKLNAENLELKEKLNETMLALENSKRALAASDRLAPDRAEASAPRRPRATAEEEIVAQATSRANAQAAQNSRGQAPAAGSASFRTYTVQPGDTLSNISRKFYRTTNRWKDIYNANRDRMSSPTQLKVGQILRIPN
ncbi:MAG: LysM peptidoglycan-binding domain-containing protein [Opitutales bacterium]|nr:LysM peptidoglycan-binding domain-containing protein [Opitutales bacterium]